MRERWMKKGARTVIEQTRKFETTRQRGDEEFGSLSTTKNVPTLGPWVRFTHRFSPLFPLSFFSFASSLTYRCCVVVVTTPPCCSPTSLFVTGVAMDGDYSARGADRGVCVWANVHQIIASELFQQDRRSRRNESGRS